MDKVHDQGVVVPSRQLEGRKHIFHRRYVIDGDHLFRDGTNKRKQKLLLDQALKERGSTLKPLEIRTIQDDNVKASYYVPALDVDGPTPSLMLRFVREIFLKAVEHLIIIESSDDARVRSK
jgi:hypothetical protein